MEGGRVVREGRMVMEGGREGGRNRGRESGEGRKNGNGGREGGREGREANSHAASGPKSILYSKLRMIGISASPSVITCRVASPPSSPDNTSKSTMTPV